MLPSLSITMRLSSRMRRFFHKFVVTQNPRLGYANTLPSWNPPFLNETKNNSFPSHFCSNCGKPRSSKYHSRHSRHPVAWGERSIPGICSRRGCANVLPKKEGLHDSSGRTVQIHHYSHVLFISDGSDRSRLGAGLPKFDVHLQKPSRYAYYPLSELEGTITSS